MLILRLCFGFLRLLLAVCGPSLSPSCFWFVSDKSSPLFLICAWKIDIWPRQYNFLSDTIIFDFQSKGIAVNIRELLTFNRYAEQHFDIDAPCGVPPRDSRYPEHLAISVNSTGTTLRARLSNTDTTLRARLSKSWLLSPIQYLPIYIFSLFTRGLLGCLLGFWPRAGAKTCHVLSKGASE